MQAVISLLIIAAGVLAIVLYEYGLTNTMDYVSIRLGQAAERRRKKQARYEKENWQRMTGGKE